MQSLFRSKIAIERRMSGPLQGLMVGLGLVLASWILLCRAVLAAPSMQVKGAIHTIEIRSQASADWVFVPERAGRDELHCSVLAHSEAGMVGAIAILGEQAA